MAFSFVSARKIVFGSGSLNQLSTHLKGLNVDAKKSKALVVHGKSKNRASPVFDVLTGAYIYIHIWV